ncbi:hypothetical protein NDU88_006013 [Pleurodeles waltl]|uniref:Uncharacterized protein n=1 Tax=Pleurodeles waltl TaxID=8319 RepID=A0AAV7L5R4_PLEWA|nr:hypothetical protein NDU88_006013 [Pleurodeles waltl]
MRRHRGRPVTGPHTALGCASMNPRSYPARYTGTSAARAVTQAALKGLFASHTWRNKQNQGSAFPLGETPAPSGCRRHAPAFTSRPRVYTPRPPRTPPSAPTGSGAPRPPTALSESRPKQPMGTPGYTDRQARRRGLGGGWRLPMLQGR